MPHPLALKYGSADPKAWDPVERANARDALYEALGSSRSTGAPLTAGDRIELMRIWLAVIAAENGEDKSAKPAPTPAAQKTRSARFRFHRPAMPEFVALKSLMKIMRPADYVFILVLCTITISVVALGIHAVQEVLRMEEVKKDAEGLAQWFKTTSDERKTADFIPSACRKAETSLWKECQAALMAKGGPLSDKENAFEPGRALMSRKCDQQDVETIGTIIVEKGTLAPGSSTYSYTAIDGTESLNKDMTLRIIVCGRGFHLIKVQTDVTW